MSARIKTVLPGPRSEELMARRREHVARGPFHMTPIFVRSAKGALLTDVDGNQLIDFASGIGVVNVGHGSPRVVRALQEQAQNLIHASFNVTPYESYIQLAEKLNQMTPGKFKKKTFLANSGAEAVENAVKIARAHTRREAVISFEHAFHGRTYMAMSLTHKESPYKNGFGPFNDGVYRAPFPYVYRWPGNPSPDRVADECFETFCNLAEEKITTARLAGVIIEPVLGEGGFVPAPVEFLNKLQAFCNRHGTVLIADEIQTGFGRTGTLFASEQLGFIPDLVLSAKGLGGGMPISAVTGRAEMMDAPVEGGIGGTFGGNPLCCKAALAVFETLERDGLLGNAKSLGMYLEETLAGWKKRYEIIGDARGLGPMRALELVKDRATREPWPEAAKFLVRYCYQKGLVIMTAGSYGNIIRLLIPLMIGKEELHEGLAILETGIREFVRGTRV